MSISRQAPWLQFYGNTPATLDYPSRTMYQQVVAAAKSHPSHIAYDFMGKTTTYPNLIARLEKTAQALAARGIQKGDHVTICMPNCPQAVDCLYALNRLGAIACMIHPLSAPNEIVDFINGAKSKAMLTLQQFAVPVLPLAHKFTQDTEIWVAEIQEEFPVGLQIGFNLTKKPKLPKLPKTGYTWWKTVLKGSAKLPADTGTAQDIAIILYSGGTTGTSKGILLSNHNFNALALQTAAASGIEGIENQKMLAVMPIFHGFGLGVGVHTALAIGMTCVLIPQFSLDVYAKVLLSKKPNVISGVPSLFDALASAKALEKADLSFLTGVFSGGDTLPVPLKRKMDQFLADHGAKCPIREGYGTTECVTASCLTPVCLNKEGSIGIPYPDTFYKIVKPDTYEELPPNNQGEICISGPSVMVGYLDNEAETKLVLHQHGDGRIWLHTGDLGQMDGDGFVYFLQRLKRMIVTNGYNVYPIQQEEIFLQHPAVRQVCVVGVKDEVRGQRVRAYVVPEGEGTEALKEELLAHCRLHIAKYAMPREIVFKDSLPTTKVGKIAYRQLEEED